MKKLLASLGAILILVVVACLFPLKQDVQDAISPKMEAYCPTVMHVMPSGILIKAIEDKSTPDSLRACGLDIIVTRLADDTRSSDAKVLELASIAGLTKPDVTKSSLAFHLINTHINRFIQSGRPDLAAYFMYRDVKRNISIFTLELAKFYADGRAVEKNEEMAKHLYRQAHIYSFSVPHMVTNEDIPQQSRQTCHDGFLEDIRYAKTDLEKEQIKWLQELCYKSKEELYDIAALYMDKNNIYRQPRLSFHILSNFYNPQSQGKVQALMEAIRKELR